MTIGPEALGALEDCSDVMPTRLCDESQLAAVAKESEADGIQIGIFQALCALRGDRLAFAVLGDEWTCLLRDAVRTAYDAEQHPDGPKKFFRIERVGTVARGDDQHALTDDEFDAEWGWWS